MYKKIFMGIAAAAALTLVSCSSDDLNSLSDNSSKNEAISFDGYLGRSAVSVNGSRGSVLDKEKLKTDGFGVFGNYNEANDVEFGSNLFNNEKVTSSSSTEPVTWTYTNTKYWPTQGHIDFLAYAPHVNGTTLKNTSCIDFTVANKVAEQKDLLWANATNQTKDQNSGENKVNFTFKHALAKIGYTVKTSAHDPGTAIKLNKITLAGSADGKVKAFYPKGTINLSTGDWTPSTSDEKQNFEWFSNASGTDVTTIATGNESGNFLFVIPQKFSTSPSDELYVIVDYTIQTGSTAMKSRVSSKITKDFDKGKAYTINLTLGLTPIEFDVTTVEKWIEGGKEDITLK